MQTAIVKPKTSFGRSIFGFAIGLVIILIINSINFGNFLGFIHLPNLFLPFVLPIIVIFIASDLAHLSKPSNIALMGALLAGISTLANIVFISNYIFPETPSSLEDIARTIIICGLSALVYSIFGFILGLLLEGYRERKGFLF